MKIQTLLAGAATAALTAGASAAFVVVDDLGGPVKMNAVDLPDILDGQAPDFSDNELSGVHTVLNANGIATDGYVTFLLANTDAGLSFLSLVDNPDPIGAGNGGLTSEMLISTTGPDTLSAWFNADGDDQTSDIGFGDSRTAQAIWTWDGDDEGRGFAWSNLQNGDTVSMFFRDRGTPALGGDQHPVFQFISYEDGEFQQVATAEFTIADQYVFSFFTIPGPGAVALLCGAAGLAGTSRRRRIA